MILAAVLTLTLGGAEVVRVAPSPLEWNELQREFDLRWLLPEHPGEGPDLLAEMESLLAERFELRDDGRVLRSFGDLAAAAGELKGGERAGWLERLSKKNRELFGRRGEAFRQLLLDDRLRDRWDPGSDHERDGFLHRPAWKAGKKLPAPWKDIGKRPTFEQVAVLFRADLTAFKQAESDYRPYKKNVGSRYLAIYPLRNGHFRGEDPEERPFAVSRIYWKADLPFPFGTYECELNVLNRVDDRGRMVSDVYSTSEDFHWMAGRDVFLPVEDSGGEWVGTLVVRSSGFDLDGVPDSGAHRRKALRESLGNIKRRAEPRFAARGSRDIVAAGTVPEFELTGNR